MLHLPTLISCRFAALLFATMALSGPTGAVPVAIYNENADVTRDLEIAGERARDEHKLVLVVFGANWCPDCRGFAAETGRPPLLDVLERNYVIVKVDVGRFNKNVGLAASVGLDVRRGIPSMAVVTQTGPVAIADGKLMDKLRAGGPEAMAVYLQAIVTVHARPAAQ